MEITRNTLESCVSEINRTFGLFLSVQYFEGGTRLYCSENIIDIGTTSECLKGLAIFMHGVNIGRRLETNSEVKNK